MPKDDGPRLGKRFENPDIERLGIFAEMPCVSGEYNPLKPNWIQGKNFIGAGPKLKTGKSDCYFDKEFKRVFEGEAIKGRGRKAVPVKFKPVSKFPFKPVGPTKWHSSPGDWYGTFDPSFPYMSGKPVKKGKFKPEKINFLTQPGKKGGPGYKDITIDKYPSHSDDRYAARPKYKQYGKILDGPMITAHYPEAYFEKNPYKLPKNIPIGKTYVMPKVTPVKMLGPGKIQPAGNGKLMGGCKCGGFNKYPSHSEDKYFTVWDLDKHKKLVGTKWDPHSTGLKSMFTCSVVDENVRFRLNERTLKTFEPTFIKYLMN